MFPYVLLPHQFVDLIIQVPDLEIAQTGFLDLGYFSRDFLQDLASPFFTDGDGGY